MRGASGPMASAMTKGGSTTGSPRRTGSPAPGSHHSSATTGVKSARIVVTPATGCRHVKAACAMLTRNPSAARAAARISAAPITAVARPIHTVTGSSALGGCTGRRVTTIASARATRATPHATRTTRLVSGRRTARSAATRMPPMTQAGGVPGPPGSRSRRDGEPTASAPGMTPRSVKRSQGFVSRRRDQGRRSSNGTTTMPTERRTRSRPRRPDSPAATSPAMTAMTSQTHTDGAHATTTAASSAAPQGVRPVAGASAEASPRDRVTTRAKGGSRTMAIITPRRPLAKAPVIAGSSAYATAAQARGPRAPMTSRSDHHALSPAAGTARKRTRPTMSPALPRTTVASAASKAVSGAAGTVEPGPTSCQVSV